MKKLEGKVAVVTGGNSGIGLAAAKLFREHGATVPISGRDKKSLEEAVEAIGVGMTTAAAWRHIPKDECPHLARFQRAATSEKTECEQCGLAEDLRICLTCGYVGCCESHGSHDTAHFKSAGHPLIRPHRSDYDWIWCYECNAFLR